MKKGKFKKIKNFLFHFLRFRYRICFNIHNNKNSSWLFKNEKFWRNINEECIR